MTKRSWLARACQQLDAAIQARMRSVASFSPRPPLTYTELARQPGSPSATSTRQLSATISSNELVISPRRPIDTL